MHSIEVTNCLHLAFFGTSPIQIVRGFPPYVLYDPAYFKKWTGGGKTTGTCTLIIIHTTVLK